MRVLMISTLAILLGGIAGCATVSKSECETRDWRNIGLRAGAAGYGEERYTEDLEACQKHGIPVDREQWMDGHARGLERYCTAHNGYVQGANRAAYQGTCPKALEADFLGGYHRGVELAEARERLAQMTHRIAELRERLAPREHQEGRPPADAPSEADQIAMAVELGELLVRREQAADDVRALESRGADY